MSQLETLMVLGLGSALTFVFFLLFGRVFWNMAMSAGARRSARNVPVQVLELQADRDRLRAEHAMMARKLELRLEDIKSRMTEQMAEVSRNRNRVQSLMMDVDSKDKAIIEKDRVIAELETKVDMQKAEIRALGQTADSHGKDMAEKAAELAKLQAAHDKVAAALTAKTGKITELNKELRSALKMAASPASDGPFTPDDRLRQRVAELTSISIDMANQSSVSPMTPTTTEAPTELQARMDTTAEEADVLETELKSMDSFLKSETTHPAPRKAGGTANVISLAQRIRALQKGMDE